MILWGSRSIGNLPRNGIENLQAEGQKYFARGVGVPGGSKRVQELGCAPSGE